MPAAANRADSSDVGAADDGAGADEVGDDGAGAGEAAGSAAGASREWAISPAVDAASRRASRPGAAEERMSMESRFQVDAGTLIPQS